jgi:hypothetical protein
MADIHGRIEALLLTVDSQIKAEKTRVKAEFAADSANNDDDRDTKNKAALEAKNGDLTALLKFEADMKATYDRQHGQDVGRGDKGALHASIKYHDTRRSSTTTRTTSCRRRSGSRPRTTGRTTATLLVEEARGVDAARSGRSVEPLYDGE